MPKRIYVGASDAVNLELNNQLVTVVRGAEVEVDDVTAAEMDKSAAWSKTKPTKPATSGKE